MSVESLEEGRLKKLAYVREIANPYPDRFSRTHELAEAAQLSDGVGNVKIAGRITLIRMMGKL